MRTLRFGLLLLAAALFAVPSLSYAQVRIPGEAVADQAEIQRTLDEGAQLEKANRWGEALTLYEDALKKHPGNRDLDQRMTVSRIHWDLGRRYNDTTYLTSLRTTTEPEALDLYGEILKKLESHYVDKPDWNRILTHGADTISIALSEPMFSKGRIDHVPASVIQDFQRELRAGLASREVRDREHAKAMAGWVAKLAKHRIGIPPQVTLLEFACGAVGTLDPYSSFLTEGQLNEVFSQIEGNFVGLGIELKTTNEALKIVNVIPGGPADLGGIQAGDMIVAVDGQTVTELTGDGAADLLKGVEGSAVVVAVQSEGDATRTLRLKRARVEVPSIINTAIVDAESGIGYLKLTSFQKTTVRDFDAALWDLHRKGMKSLIVDLRGNPGGLLTASVELADKFIAEGTIVSTRGRIASEDFDYRAHRVGTWRVPLIVLIDHNSASASEIFAGAIHDHRRGAIVGETSYGKGSVQGIFPLAGSKSGVRLTTAKFYAPSGTAISRRGVDPTVRVRTTARGELNDDNQNDAIYNAGMQVARQQLSQLP